MIKNVHNISCTKVKLLWDMLKLHSSLLLVPVFSQYFWTCKHSRKFNIKIRRIPELPMLNTMKSELLSAHLWGGEHTYNTVITCDITYCGFTEFLCCHFVGNVCSHQHTDVYSHLLSNNVRDQFQSLWAFIYSLQPTLNAITKKAFSRHSREESIAQ